MQTRPTGWAAIFAKPHRTEYRYTIADTEYTDDDILDTPVIEKPLMKEPVIGRCCTGSLSFTIRKRPNHVIPKAAKVNVRCRIKTSAEVTPWADLGQYWISKRSGSDVITFTCRDAMLFAGRTYNDRTKFTTWPVPMTEVVKEIASLMGVPIDPRTTINTGSAYVVDYPNEDVLMSEILAHIAAAHGGVFIITETGKLRLVPFPDTGNPVFSIQQEYSDYVPFSTGEKSISRVTLNDIAGNQFAYGDSTGMELAANCDYATYAMACDLGNALIGNSIQPYSLSGAYIDPLIELGDTFSITYKGYTVQLVAGYIILQLSAYPTAELGLGESEDAEEEVPYVSASELSASRFITTRQSYRGNRINRKEGFVSELIVEGEPVSRMIANSEQFSMQRVNPDSGSWENILYFDPVKRQYKFVGEVDIQVEGSGVNTYYQGSPPTDNLRDGDLWIDTDDGNLMYRYDANTGGWNPIRDLNVVKYGRNYLLDGADVLEIVNGTRTPTKRSNYYSLDPELFEDSGRGKQLRISFDLRRTNIETQGSESSTSVYAGFFITYTQSGSGEEGLGRGYRLRSTDSNFVSTDTDWVRIKLGPMDITSFNPTSLTGAYFELNRPYTGKVEIRNVQIEVTDEFTDWKPASRDLSHLSERVSSTELKVTDSAIINSVRSNAKYYYDINYGRNYLINSDKLCKFVNAVLDKDSINSYPFSDSFYHDSNAGEQIRISFDIKRTGCAGDSNGRYGGIWVYLTTSEENASSTPFGWYMTTDQKWYSATDTDFVRIEFVYASLKPKNPVSFQRLFVSAYGRGTLEIKNVKVEVTADRYTPWCFALEDSGSAFVTLEERIRSAELKITDSAIVAAVTSSTQYQTDLNGKANSGELSALAQRVSSAELKITDSSIVSTVTSSTQYKTDLNGKASASSVNGKADSATIISTINQSAEQVLISASKIKIGAFTFGQADVGGGLPDSLYCGGQLNSGSKTCTGIGASNSAWAFWAGSGVFRVAQSGAMWASNAAISGQLSAGGWTFDSSGSSYSNNGVGVNMTVYSGSFVGSDDESATYRAFYGSSGCDVQYGSDYSKTAYIRAGRIKIINQNSDAMWDWSSVIFRRSSTGQATITCGESTGSKTGEANGNIGASGERWDYVYCNVLKANSYPSSSSRAVKQNIEDLPDVGDIIDRLAPVSYEYKDEPGRRRLGLIYEDVLDVVPEACIEDKDGEKGIQYTEFISILLRECKSLRERVKVLEQAS